MRQIYVRRRTSKYVKFWFLLQVPFLGHFVSGQKADLLDDTSPDWLPTQNLGSSTAIGRWKRWYTKQTGKDDSLQESTSDSVMATHSDIQDEVPIQESKCNSS